MTRLPIFFQCVHANLSTRLADVWMKDFCDEEACIEEAESAPATKIFEGPRNLLVELQGSQRGELASLWIFRHGTACPLSFTRVSETQKTYNATFVPGPSTSAVTSVIFSSFIKTCNGHHCFRTAPNKKGKLGFKDSIIERLTIKCNWHGFLREVNHEGPWAVSR